VQTKSPLIFLEDFFGVVRSFALNPCRRYRAGTDFLFI
jgi:hypothetical protein